MTHPETHPDVLESFSRAERVRKAATPRVRIDVPVSARLDRIAQAFVSSAGLILPHGSVEQAAEKAQARLDALVGAEGERLALLDFAGGLLVRIAQELSGHLPDLTDLIDECERTGLSRLELGREVLRDEDLLELPREEALNAVLSFIVFFGKLEAASVWHIPPGGALTGLGYAGSFDPNARKTRDLARKLLGDEEAADEDPEDACGFVVSRWKQPPAVVVARGAAARTLQVQALIEAALPVTITLLEREQAAASGRITHRDVLSSAERRLSRMRFDLHDGPQQDLVLLAEDLALFRAQLALALDEHPDCMRVIGRVDDLQARLVALDGDIRRISSMLQSPFLQQENLADALTQLADSFTVRSGLDPHLKITGDLAGLTDSQHITLVGLIRESLNNIREHSDAENVSVEVVANEEGVEVVVCDDGRGFEPERTLVEAARGGHLGLVGMHERVRLLGGQTQIESRVGGPTVISVSLPKAPAGVPRRR